MCFVPNSQKKVQALPLWQWSYLIPLSAWRTQNHQCTATLPVPVGRIWYQAPDTAGKGEARVLLGVIAAHAPSPSKTRKQGSILLLSPPHVTLTVCDKSPSRCALQPPFCPAEPHLLLLAPPLLPPCRALRFLPCLSRGPAPARPPPVTLLLTLWLAAVSSRASPVPPTHATHAARWDQGTPRRSRGAAWPCHPCGSQSIPQPAASGRSAVLRRPIPGKLAPQQVAQGGPASRSHLTGPLSTAEVTTSLAQRSPSSHAAVVLYPPCYWSWVNKNHK